MPRHPCMAELGPWSTSKKDLSQARVPGAAPPMAELAPWPTARRAARPSCRQQGPAKEWWCHGQTLNPKPSPTTLNPHPLPGRRRWCPWTPTPAPTPSPAPRCAPGAQKAMQAGGGQCAEAPPACDSAWAPAASQPHAQTGTQAGQESGPQEEREPWGQSASCAVHKLCGAGIPQCGAGMAPVV